MTIRERYNLANKMRIIVNRIRNKVKIAGYKMSKMAYNILTATKRYKAVQADAITGLPDTRQPKQSEQIHISKHTDYDMQAMREAIYIKRAFRGACTYFDVRLKNKKQHRNGGHY